MNREEAMHLAAQAWCTPANKKTEMDPDLASAFADILMSYAARRDDDQDMEDSCMNSNPCRDV